MIGFDAIHFDVFPAGDGYLPMPVAMASETDLATLRNTR
jgi:hypothetical protein